MRKRTKRKMSIIGQNRKINNKIKRDMHKKGQKGNK